MKNFIINNWGQIVFVASMLISFLNAATKHYSTNTGFVKYVSYVVGFLSFITSRDAANVLKVPLTPEKQPEYLPSEPKNGGKISVLIPLALSLLISGCVTIAGKLEAASTATQMTATIGADLFAIRCTERAKECKAKSDTKCIAWEQCSQNRERFKIAIFAIQNSLKTTNEILHTEGIIK